MATMFKRPALVLLLLCLIIFIPAFALATENEDDFVSPTRPPGAPDYDSEHPEELVPEQIVARAYILIEPKTGNVLDSRNADMLLFPASTTKILTALIALQYGNLEDTLTVSANAVNIPEDASRVPFKENEVVTLKDALYGLMLRSGNEAAIAIAEYVDDGDVNAFVARMNQAAQMMGCTNTHFTNPHGYHDDAHYTTAEDLATMFIAALRNDTFREIIGTYSYALAGTKENPPRAITNSNIHLNLDPENYYRYVDSKGGKTGFTSAAGYVLVEVAERDGVELVCVAMYSGKYSRWMDTKWLFDYGFEQYTSITPEEIYAQNPITLQISGFSLDDRELMGELEVDIQAQDTTRAVRFIDENARIEQILSNYSDYTSIEWTSELRAPIAKGQKMGTITFFPPNEESVTYDLVASRSIDLRENAPPSLEEIEQRVAEDPSPFPPLSLDWILPPILWAGGGLFVVYQIYRFIRRRRKRAKRLPTPKKRTFN